MGDDDGRSCLEDGPGLDEPDIIHALKDGESGLVEKELVEKGNLTFQV